MRSHFRVVIGSIASLCILVILIFWFRLGGPGLLAVGRYSQLLAAFISAVLTLVSVNIPIRQEENAETWMKREKLAWTLIGCAFVPWFIGECFWRYYVVIGESPFPSLADLGYFGFAPLILTALFLLPSPKSNQKHVSLLLDSLIVTGTLLSIAWFLVLGSLAQAPTETPLGKFLSLYYPIADTLLLSCLIFLLLRGFDWTYRVPARRISLLIVGSGLAIYAAADFLFNVLNTQGLYQDGSWIDSGWALGLFIIGLGGYLRRFLPRDTAQNNSEEQVEGSTKQTRFGLTQLLPYFLLIILFVVLGFNVLSSDKIQQSIRPVLLVATLIVIGLVIVRQIITMQENDHLMQKQMNTLKKLEKVYHDVENRKIKLEEGVNHLKEVQTRLANGDVRARAQIMGGDLWPLATGLNLMADRMMRSEHNQRNAQKLVQAIGDLSLALEDRGNKFPVVLPSSCLDVPELHHLLTVLGLRPPVGTPSQPTPLSPTTSQHQPSALPGRQNNFPRSTQRATL